jgi:hypothetical protein
VAQRCIVGNRSPRTKGVRSKTFSIGKNSTSNARGSRGRLPSDALVEAVDKASSSPDTNLSVRQVYKTKPNRWDL